jgi:hypothetical protein
MQSAKENTGTYEKGNKKRKKTAKCATSKFVLFKMYYQGD